MRTEQTVMRENYSLVTSGQMIEAVTKIPVMDLASVCSSNGSTREVTGGACDRKGLGISLSTPIVMMSTGVVGNLLALLILFTAEKQVRRTSFFPLLMAMAVSDLVGQAATGAIAVLVYANNLQWVGGRPVCLYHGFTMVFFAVITPLLVCSMSVERLLALRYSYFYQRCFTHSIARWVVVGSVSFTLFFCSWPLMGFGSYEQQFPGSWCFLNYHRQSLKDTIYALTFSILNIAIIFFIMVCNVMVVYTLLKMRRLRHQMNAVPGKAGRKMLQTRQRSRSGLNLEMETQMVWFLMAITVVFSCLWLPINVHILMNQITGKVDYKQDLISVRLASINQIIDPWMYVIFRKGTFLKLLRRLRLFLTNRKQGAMSSMKQSHSCEDHRLKPLMHTRSQSCPPAVCYSVDGSMVPSVHVKDHLLPKDVFCGLSASARLSDDVEVVKRKPIQTLVPSEEGGSDMRRQGPIKTQTIPSNSENKENAAKKGVLSNGSLNVPDDNTNCLKKKLRKIEHNFDTEYDVDSANNRLTKTKLPLDHVENDEIKAASKIKTNGNLENTCSSTDLVTSTNEPLDIKQVPNAKEVPHENSQNKQLTCENDGSMLLSERDCCGIRNGAKCFFENELRTYKKGAEHVLRNNSKKIEKKQVPAEDIETHVGRPPVDIKTITNNHNHNQILGKQNLKDPGPDIFITPHALDDTTAGCELGVGLDPLMGQLPSLPAEFCKIDNDYALGFSVHTKSCYNRQTCVADTKSSETTPLLLTNGCVDQCLQTSVDLCHCSNHFCKKTYTGEEPNDERIFIQTEEGHC